MSLVPTSAVKAKQEQYRSAPDSGSVIVKDSQETWEPVSPDLKGFDSQFDMRAIRQMIDAGSGLPPHWRGEATDASLATAQAMEHSASRHLRRRQLYLRFVVQDLAFVAYARAAELGKTRARANRDLIAVNMTDIDRQDNRDLAQASRTIANALSILNAELIGKPDLPPTSPTLKRLILSLVMRFAGEPLDGSTVDKILAELPAPIAPPTDEEEETADETE